MKTKILFFSIILLISGCVLSVPYDTNEYLLLTKLEADSRILLDVCPNPTKAKILANEMYQTSETFVTFTRFRISNELTYKIAKILRDNVKELKESYDTNSTESNSVYCLLKGRILIKTTQRALEAVGSKMRQ